jgi:hypothetical protein
MALSSRVIPSPLDLHWRNHVCREGRACVICPITRHGQLLETTPCVAIPTINMRMAAAVTGAVLWIASRCEWNHQASAAAFVQVQHRGWIQKTTPRTLVSARSDGLESVEHIVNGPINNGTKAYFKSSEYSLLEYVTDPPYENDYPIVLLEWDIDQLRVFIEKLEASRSSNMEPPPSMAEFFSPDADEFRLVDCLLDHVCYGRVDPSFWRLHRAGFEVCGAQGAMELALALSWVEHDP